MELLKEVAPNIKRVAFIFDPKVAPGGGSYYTNLIGSVAPSFAVAPTTAPVHGAVEIESAIEKLAREPNGGLLAPPDTTTRTYRRLIVTLAGQYRVPAIYDTRDVVVDGGLLSYGDDMVDSFRRAAGYVDRILKGAKPSELPVQAPVKFEMAINLKTAKALGLDVPLLYAAASRRGDRVTARACPLLAQSGHDVLRRACPLLGVKRTWLFAAQMSAFDGRFNRSTQHSLS